MTQKPVFLEGLFTLRNLRSMGAAAVLEVLIAAGVAGILIWQQVRDVTEQRPVPKPIIDIQGPPPLPHLTPVPQSPPQAQPLHEVQPVPAEVPTPMTQPVSPPQPPLLPAQHPPLASDLVSEFSASMLCAINAQKVYPKAPLLQGVSGETVVSFDYVNGVVSNIRVDRSSGSRELDRAAVQAVQRATLPPEPAELVGLNHFEFTLVFDLAN